MFKDVCLVGTSAVHMDDVRFDFLRSDIGGTSPDEILCPHEPQKTCLSRFTSYGVIMEIEDT